MLGTQVLQLLLQQRTHGDDTISHALDFTQPLLVQGLVVQDLGCDSCAVDWGVRIEGSDEDFDLRVDALLLLCVGADDGEGSYTLTVETLY